MGKPFPYFRFYPRDYFEATRVLTLEERGAYMDIICLEMMLEGALRDDDDLLSHHLHISKRKWRPLKAALVAHGKLSVEGGMIVNDRCVRELAALLDERRNRSDAAVSREKERKNGSPVRGRVRAEPTPKAAKKSKEINEIGTTTVAQRQNTGNPVVDDLLNAVQPRFDADSALTRARMGDEPAPNAHEKLNEINETGSTVVPLRARVTDSDKDKKETTTTAHARGAAVDDWTADELRNLEGRLITAANGCLADPAGAPGLLSLADPLNWIREGCSIDQDILPTLRSLGAKNNGKRIRSWNFFTNAVFESRNRRIRKGPELPQVSAEGGRPRAWRPGR